MAFRFVLAPLLRLRQSVERQRALQLQEATLEVTRVRESLGRLEQFLAESARADHANLEQGRRGAELQFASLLRLNLEALRHSLETELGEAERKQQGAAEEYHRAFREREVLETLRTHQRRTYQQESLRREQRDLDAAHLIQRWRGPAR